MQIRDSVDYPVSGASPGSLEHLEAALHELRCYIRDPVATVTAALAAAPEMVMGHVVMAYLHLLGTEPSGLPVARQACQDAARFPATERERRHVAAVQLLADGCWRDAGRALEDLSIDHPRDALALQAGHVIDFFTGDTRMLRDRIARALPLWNETLPGYHAILGMHAFGLEETGDYRQAEAEGRRGVELEPRDGWSQHAVAHVMEMQNRQRDGIAWMRANPHAWSHESFFAVHNWWHLALYHLDLGEIDEVLALYDGPIYGKLSPVVLDMIDASALLWRLTLRGVDVGNRWAPLADNWEKVATASTYAFNDMHAMMAFAGAARGSAADALLETEAASMQQPGDNAAFTREVGSAATRAIKAFGEGNFAETIRLLRPIRSTAHRFGGSHAQRDLLDLTLIEAALRGGEKLLATALVTERVAAKPDSTSARLFKLRLDSTPKAAQ